MEMKILGTSYNLEEKNRKEAPSLTDSIDGYTDTSTKEMVVDEMKESGPGMKGNLSYYKKHVKRHEIIHAFLFESGLDTCCDWVCEEMVDWLAIQFPKMQKAMEESGAL